MSEPFRLVDIELDAESLQAASADVEQERRVAIFDLLEANSFRPVGSHGGPYVLRLALEQGRLVFDIRTEGLAPPCKIIPSLTPFPKIWKDHFFV